MESEVREPRQKRAIEKKEKIIKAGFDLICKNGYYSTNTAEIAKTAEVSTGIVYQYFKDKHDIFMAAMEKYGEGIFFPMLNTNENFKIQDFDKLIKNIIKILNEPKEYKKVRNNSTRLKTPFKFDFHSNAIKSAAKHINVFDGELDLESKITLQNTIINKFHKEVLGTNDDICDQDLNIA